MQVCVGRVAFKRNFLSCELQLKIDFGEEADSEGLLIRFEAHIEGGYLGNMDGARELWEELIYWHSGEVEYWLQYAQLEW